MSEYCVTCGSTEEQRAQSWEMSLELMAPYVVRPCCGKSQKQIKFEREMAAELGSPPVRHACEDV